ncbi:MAG: hypothetical protein U0744_03255 [Gemmataceae bacterium]
MVKVRDNRLEIGIGYEYKYKKETHVWDLADDVRFEEIELKIVNGKLKTSRKSITKNDLFSTQPIELIAFRAGTQVVIVLGVVTRESALGSEGLKLAAKLGGKVKDASWSDDEKLYDVDLAGCRVTDEDLAILARIDNLSYLDLTGAAITDGGVAHFSASPTVQHCSYRYQDHQRRPELSFRGSSPSFRFS